MSLVDIRSYVRSYFDLDVEDLPDVLLDRWTNEGWGKIIRFRPNWPGFQTTTSVIVFASQAEYASPLKDIESIEGPDRYLTQFSASEAERRFIRGGIPDPAGKPVAYSVYGSQVRLWPVPDTAGTYAVRGQRSAVAPITNPDTAPLDLPTNDAVDVLLSWVLYRTSLRESEDVQAAGFLDSFSQGLQLLAKDEVDVPAFVPIVANSIKPGPTGLSTYLPDRLRFDDGWDV